MTYIKANGATLGSRAADDMALPGHTEDQHQENTTVAAPGQSNFVRVDGGHYRKADFAEAMRRESMRGRDWADRFTDIPAAKNRARIAALQARESGTRDPFALVLGVPADE